MSEDVRLFNGDCLDVLPTLAAGSVDAVVTDPPYGLEFMGKEWDRLSDDPVSRSWDSKGRTMTGKPVKDASHPGGCCAAQIHKAPNPRCTNCGRAIRGRDTAKGFKVCHCENPGWSSTNVYGVKMQAWHQRWAAAALRVLRPGGYLLAFGGTRTFHRLACALEDAGFEMRDTILWLHAQGFPKGKGCLKPAFEPVLLCRRPGPRVLPLGIDECQVPAPEGLTNGGKRWPNHSGVYAQDEWTQNADSLLERSEPHPAGRYPANVCHDGSPEVLEAFAAFGNARSAGEYEGKPTQGRKGFLNDNSEPGWGYADAGTAARFFYTAKASRRERNAGLEGMPEQTAGVGAERPSGSMHERYGDANGSGKTPKGQNNHPTVKPLALMRWLVKLACPAGGVVLDPFMGSGTTGVACVETGRRFIGIESDPGYFAIAEKRIAAARDAHPLFAEAL